MRRTWRKRTEPDGTADLPPAGADRALFGTVVEMPYLERAARDRALKLQAKTARKANRRTQRRKLRQVLRQAVRPGLVLVLDMLGVCGLVYSAWLIWLPLAWALASAFALALAWVLDAPPELPGGE